ncbi:MAG: lipoprotein [Pseudomonadales bacterium]|jgi:predicted small lipoprotein YifL|nr:lipoprotein [Pseudomonadales bacterium]
MKTLSFLSFLLLLLGCLTLGGCGQKGPLSPPPASSLRASA